MKTEELGRWKDRFQMLTPKLTQSLKRNTYEKTDTIEKITRRTYDEIIVLRVANVDKRLTLGQPFESSYDTCGPATQWCGTCR